MVRTLLLGVIVLILAVLLVVELGGLLLGRVFRFLLVDEVGPLGLGQLVHLGAREPGQ